MMERIGLIAAREFVTSVSSRGFLVGLLLMPALIGIVTVVAPRVINARPPQIRGEVAVVDPTGQVLDDIERALSEEAIVSRRAEATRRALERLAPGVPPPPASPLLPVPALRVVPRPAGRDLQPDKDWLLTSASLPEDRHLALVAIRPDAVVPAEHAADYGTYDLYIARNVDDATEAAIYDGVRQALISARLEAKQIDRTEIEAAVRVERPRSVIVAPGGEQPAQRGFTRALPFIMGLLLFLGTMIGGQALMTSMIEEKSSRVVEVLLAAVSPFELMAGKLIGQLGVGLLMIGVYAGLGMLALFQFAMLGLVDPLLVVYLVIFFLLSYLIFGALMAAIGAAVNQMADAQSLMGPVMLLMIGPYVLSPTIGRSPNSTLSVTLSFLPPVNGFAMLARLASDTPPPFWQVGLTMLLGLAAAAVAVWFAAKIFKTGLLMHGKPPNFATLVRWAWQA